MISKLHDKLGTAGLVVAVVALVAALTGTAIAGLPGLNSKQKKQVTKIAQKEAKKFAQAGPQGSKGDPGSPGVNGKDGAQGAPGAAGKSVVAADENPGANCSEGGLSVEVEGSGVKNFICNGEEGAEGPSGSSVELGTPTGGECPDGGVTVVIEGQPGSKKAVCNGETGFTETLPSGETETGLWTYTAAEAGPYRLALSFPIPLAAEIEAAKVHYINPAGEEVVLNEETFEPEGVPQTACDGSVSTPEADAGHLCVYEDELTSGIMVAGFITKGVTGGGGASKVGAVMQPFVFGEGGSGTGSWAVTAP